MTLQEAYVTFCSSFKACCLKVWIKKITCTNLSMTRHRHTPLTPVFSLANCNRPCGPSPIAHVEEFASLTTSAPIQVGQCGRCFRRNTLPFATRSLWEKWMGPLNHILIFLPLSWCASHRKMLRQSPPASLVPLDQTALMLLNCQTGSSGLEGNPRPCMRRWLHGQTGWPTPLHHGLPTGL
jgi:hypothetical protein